MRISTVAGVRLGPSGLLCLADTSAMIDTFVQLFGHCDSGFIGSGRSEPSTAILQTNKEETWQL